MKYNHKQIKHAPIAQHKSGTLPCEDGGVAPSGRTNSCGSDIFLDIKKMISRLLKEGESDATTWKALGGLTLPICLVLRWEDGSLYGKLAINVDSLQCDYDIDWEMPMDSKGFVVDSEITVNDENMDESIKWWLKEAERWMEK